MERSQFEGYRCIAARGRHITLTFLLRHNRIYSGGGHWTLAHVNGAAIFLKSGGAKFPSLAGCGDQPLR